MKREQEEREEEKRRWEEREQELDRLNFLGDGYQLIYREEAGQEYYDPGDLGQYYDGDQYDYSYYPGEEEQGQEFGQGQEQGQGQGQGQVQEAGGTTDLLPGDNLLLTYTAVSPNSSLCK